MPSVEAPRTVTVATADTPAKMAKLFGQLVRNEVPPSRDPVTCEMIRAMIPIIVEHHGEDGGPFAAWMDRMRERTMSDLQALATQLEALPVSWEGLGEYRPLYFVLNRSEGTWTPCYNAEDNRDVNGWITGGIRYPDGSTETCPAELGCWADCDADGNPSMPFVEW